MTVSHMGVKNVSSAVKPNAQFHLPLAAECTGPLTKPLPAIPSTLTSLQPATFPLILFAIRSRKLKTLLKVYLVILRPALKTPKLSSYLNVATSLTGTTSVQYPQRINSKMLETFVSDQLQVFVRRKKLQTDCQYGFR